MSSWVPAIGAAIAAIGGFIVAFYQARGKREADRELAKSAEERDRLLAELDRARDQANAQLAYEFEARKRLYMQLQPLLFQLREQSESALWRIAGFAASARNGRLSQGKQNRLKEGSSSYLPSTLYRFMAPLVSYRLCQRQLTTVDLSLDTQVDRKYRLVKLLYRTWSDGSEIADCSSRLDYAPRRTKGDRDASAITTTQHMSLQKIERIIETMILENGSGDSARCLTLGEFIEQYEDPSSVLCSVIKPMKELFTDFSPESRPVLWRMLIVQAHLYAALSRPTQDKVPAHLLNVLPREEWATFDWRHLGDEHSDQDTVEAPFAAAREYLAAQALFPRISSDPTSRTNVGVSSDSQSADGRQDGRP